MKQTRSHVFVYLINPLDPEVGSWTHYIHGILLSVYKFTRNSTSSLLYMCPRVAELGSLSSGAKMAMKIFVKGVFTIFATNAPFLRKFANLQN